MTVPPTLRLLAIGVCAAALATPAAAQVVHAQRLFIRAGVGQVNPLAIDLPYTATVWAASVEIAVAKHLIIEGMASGWHHRTESSSTLPGRDRSVDDLQDG